MSLVYPVMAQVLLTILLSIRLGILRVGAVRSRQVRMREVALDDKAYPVRTQQVGNSVRNQFETPVLFYVLCGVAIYLGATGLLMTLLAWAYVVTRVVHSAIHITHNRVQQRFIPFAVGLTLLLVMWIAVVVRLASA